VSVAAAAGRPAALRPARAGSGRPYETTRAASWDRLWAARERARAERRALASLVSGNGPRPGQRPKTALWAAVPAGYRPAVNLSHWLGAVTDAAYDGHRSDAAERRVELAWILAKHTDWTTCTSRCGWGLLADRGGVSRSTVARFLAWLRRERLLAVVSTGRTGVLVRPMALTGPPAGSAGPGSPGPGAAAAVNEAAVYVLLEAIPAPRPYQAPDPGLVGLDPRYWSGELDVDDLGRAVDTRTSGPVTADDLGDPVDETATPYGSPLVTSQSTQAHTRPRACTTCRRPVNPPLRVKNRASRSPLTTRNRPNRHPTTLRDRPPGDTGSLPDLGGPVICARCHATRWARHTPAGTAADRLALADRLRHDSPAFLWVGTARRVRWLLRDFLTAGWTAADVLHALDTHPDTGPYAYATTAPGTPGGVRNPAGWVLHRLKPWRSPDGTPLVPFSATHAAAIARRLAADRAQAAAAAVGPTTAPTTAYRVTRELLRRARPGRQSW